MSLETLLQNHDNVAKSRQQINHMPHRDSKIQTKAFLTVCSSSATNVNLSVARIFPRKTLADSDSALKTINTKPTSVMCICAIPDWVFFKGVSLRVSSTSFLLPAVIVA